MMISRCILHTICLVIGFSVHFTAQGQAFPADSAFSIIRNYNAFAAEANWTVIEPKFKAALKNATARKDSIQALVEVFEALDDVHSNFTIDNQTHGYYHGADDAFYQVVAPLFQAQQKANGVVKDTLFPEGIAYIQIPGLLVWGDAINTYAADIQTRLAKMLEQNVKGCIIDLRLNGGGNMYPMIAGLWPVLGASTVLYTVYPDATTQFEWYLEKGNLYARDTGSNAAPVTDIKPAMKKPLTELPVVVLTGYLTASSGQATAVALHGRKNTTFIGEPTADGYITSKNYFALPGGMQLNMASGFIADRNHTVYRTAFIPDQLVEGGNDFEHPENDTKVTLARTMLNKQ